MSYKDMSRGGPLEVRTRGPPFGKMPRAEQGMKRSDSIGMIEKYWNDEEEWRGYHPNACDEENKFVAAAEGKLLTVFLDYDGTLAPIVPEPDKAFMSDEMREAVRQCAKRFPTAIISGRSRQKVSQFVKLDELYYAGSHGLDIAGPKTTTDGEPIEKKLAHQPAQWARDVMDRVTKELIEKCADIPGTNIEHNMFCVSAHYRAVSEELRPRVEAVVDEICASEECLIKHDGKMVWEVRPRVAWDKGKALSYLRDALLPDLSEKGFRPEDVFTIYIGDDVTDEDAFMEINEELGDHLGVGLLVSSSPKVSAAKFSLRDSGEVLRFLTRLRELGDASTIKTLP
jgi:trehalose 6-phosphate phosphatase